MKLSVYITRKLPDEVLQPLLEKFTVRMWESEEVAVPRDVLLQESERADALLTMISDSIDAELMGVAKNLKVISNLAVGFNNIDTEAAKQRGIVVTNTPDVLTETTADLTFALVMAAARRMTSAERALRDGEWTSWSPLGFTGQDVWGTTIGIIGMGRIGEAVARRAKGFGMEVLYCNRSRNAEAEEMLGALRKELDELLAESDHVVMLAPYTDETAGMIGARELALMKPTATFISASRGGIVDEDALYDALKKGTIWAAGLDVYATEPVPSNHPLLSLPNVTAVPHIGSASVRTRMEMMRVSMQAITDVLEGKNPKHRVV
ncbi:D-glycerate dehydrogenase [Sporosarcina saromensis]|uniref:D-glycerate dehydrogenase n=1 Tax=Sporosarcina saromensis TaxID=359365 RepID=A0ABU4GH80_9BACL|nr:D-glycerate dehydrogenase [Sporosarcina saromensis]MDW0114967.1 D-glycerate dehydrogenase [Sporosarcina saromensis]